MTENEKLIGELRAGADLPPASTSHNEALGRALARDPAFAIAYINAVIEGGNHGECVAALRHIAEALERDGRDAARHRQVQDGGKYSVVETAWLERMQDFIGPGAMNYMSQAYAAMRAEQAAQPDQPTP